MSNWNAVFILLLLLFLTVSVSLFHFIEFPLNVTFLRSHSVINTVVSVSASFFFFSLRRNRRNRKLRINRILFAEYFLIVIVANRANLQLIYILLDIFERKIRSSFSIQFFSIAISFAFGLIPWLTCSVYSPVQTTNKQHKKERKKREKRHNNS